MLKALNKSLNINRTNKSMEFKYDKSGVPILSRKNLDNIALSFLAKHDFDCLDLPQATPLASICDTLSKKNNLKFIFNRDLSYTQEGYKTYGRFNATKNIIYVDKSIQWNDPRFTFVLAHEIAHFILHRKIKPKVLTDTADFEISDTKRHLIINRLDKNNPRNWIEWQANKFASSMLLPTSTVPTAVTSIQKNIGINRGIGSIYLDHQASNVKHFIEVQNYLSKLYETPKITVKIRLAELKILTEVNKGKCHSSNEMTHIKDSLKNVFEDVVTKYKSYG